MFSASLDIMFEIHASLENIFSMKKNKIHASLENIYVFPLEF